MIPKRSDWWTTPIWQFETDYTQNFHENLLNEIYVIAKNISTGLDKNPKDSLWDYETPNLLILKNKIMQIASGVILKQIQEARELNISLEYSMGWANVIGPGESIEAHAHNDASLTATYYIRAGDDSGDLVLLDTKNIIGESGSFINSYKSELNHIHIKPKEGLLVFFPAYVMHEVQPNKSKNLRISLSTDIKQKIDREAPNAMILKSWTNSFLRIKE